MDDLKWFFLVLAGLFVIWFLGGGPDRVTSKGGIFLEPPQPINSGKTYGPKSPLSFYVKEKTEEEKEAERREEALRQAETREKAVEEIKRLEEEVKALEYKVTKSPYADYVSFSDTYSMKNTNPNSEYFKITGKDKRTVISNWYVRSIATGKEIKIPDAVHLYIPGRINPKLPTALEPGDTAVISTGRSPIGVSFRVNKCSGYLEQFQDFTPSLRKECPYPKDEYIDLYKFKDNCLDYIDRLPRCEAHQKTPPAELSFECKEYITSQINYKTCVNNHSRDKDFYKNEWRIFLKRGDELWKSSREEIKLLDHDKRIVDSIEY